MNKVRTRFAPSPTGKLHVGGVRTAIFAWAYAKAHGGDFILRIEDTDKSREVEGSVEHIADSLSWLGIEWSEGPDKGGEYGSYQQSQRLEIYQDWAQKLLHRNLAYADPFTQKELQGFRDQAVSQKKPFLFRDFRPSQLSTPSDWYGKTPIRFKVSDIKRTDWHDEVRGALSAGEEALDDFIIIKADGYPTYNFAHVVDDYLMKISHVMRGEEFISSTPKFIALHEALEIPLPKLATMPPIFGEVSGKKLSKRDGAKDILEYRNQGYLPDAMVNFLSSLGWNDGTEQEVYTTEEFVDKFSLDRVQRKGAHFDNTKLDWLNWKHFEKLVETDIAAAFSMIDIPLSSTLDNDTAGALAASKSRSTEEFARQIEIFVGGSVFELSATSLQQVDGNLSAGVAKSYLESAITVLSETDFTATELEQALRNDMGQLKAEPRQYLNLIRWAVSNAKVSPNLFEMLAVLGKEESLKRLQATVEG